MDGEGAREALEGLYAWVTQRLAGFVRMRLGGSLRRRLEPCDILQATLLKSFEHLSQVRYGDTRSFMGWSMRIAENEIRDQAEYHSRQCRDRRLEVPLEAAWSEAAPTPSPLDQLLLAERTDRLTEALDALQPRYRDVIVLRSFEDLTFQEIGARLGRTEDACRMLFARATTALALVVTGSSAAW